MSSPVPCHGCGRESSFTCSKCSKERYCSRQCQKEDWKEHKEECGRRPTWWLAENYMDEDFLLNAGRTEFLNAFGAPAPTSFQQNVSRIRACWRIVFSWLTRTEDEYVANYMCFQEPGERGYQWHTERGNGGELLSKAQTWVAVTAHVNRLEDRGWLPTWFVDDRTWHMGLCRRIYDDWANAVRGGWHHWRMSERENDEDDERYCKRRRPSDIVSERFGAFNSAEGRFLRAVADQLYGELPLESGFGRLEENIELECALWLHPCGGGQVCLKCGFPMFDHCEHFCYRPPCLPASMLLQIAADRQLGTEYAGSAPADH